MMLSPGFRPFSQQTRGTWVRLRTLVVLRWLAVAGQLVAITLAVQIYQVALPLGACLMVVGTSIIANLISFFVFPQNKRLSETEAMLMLLFDISQLSDDVDEISTKLDLARAYMDMGDNEGARNILEEVKSEGNVSQKKQAEALLAKAS